MRVHLRDRRGDDEVEEEEEEVPLNYLLTTSSLPIHDRLRDRREDDEVEEEEEDVRRPAQDEPEINRQ